MRVLVTGGNGQLGHDLVRVLSSQHDVIAAGRQDADITNLSAVQSLIADVRPQCVIHAAAFTEVDRCETEQDNAFAVNALGARNVTIAAEKAQAAIVFISTDYVFDGEKGEAYTEFDTPNPQTAYGRSKLWGERFVREQSSRFFVLRTAWLYGPTGKNFVRTMLQLAEGRTAVKVVADQRGTPTYTEDLARQIAGLIGTEQYGTYHCTAHGSCSWYDFAVEVFRQAAIDVEVQPVTTAEFPRPARRPRNSTLSNYVLKLEGLDVMPDWRDGLSRFISELREMGGMPA